MESIFYRYRNLLVLLAILVAQIIGLAMQIKRPDSGSISLDQRDSKEVRLIRLWANALVAPPERAIHGVKIGVEQMWTNYIDLRHVRQQNADLEQTINRLKLEQAALLEDARQGERLQALLGFQPKYVYSTVAAQAIGSSGSQQSHVFYIDKGSNAGLKPDMAVITADGIVGKVRDVFPNSAQVLAINDPTSGAGVILETTRIRGILRGNVEGQLMIVDIMADQRIQPGEHVMTAGGDMIFPRGLPVGVVQKIVRDPDRDSFIDVYIQPAAHLDRLDEVLIVTSTEPRFPPGQQQDMAASAALAGDIAASGNQAAKDQLRASQLMEERLPGLTDPNAPVATPANTPAAPGQPQPQTPAQIQPSGQPAQPPAPKLLPQRHADKFSPPADTQDLPKAESAPHVPASRPKPPVPQRRTP